MSSKLRLIILGAPGSGKGTISSRIVRDFKVSHLSSGDILRKHIREETELGLKVKELVSRGQLVSDDLITKVVLAELGRLSSTSWLLDGFPRTLSQCKALDAKKVPVDRVINLNVPFDVIVNRLKHRWIHPPSGRVYNLEFNPPKSPMRDDVTGEPLIQRSDDREDVVLQRLKIYEKQVKPLVDYYTSKKVLETFTGNTSDFIWPLVKTNLQALKAQKHAAETEEHQLAKIDSTSSSKEPVTHTGHKYAPDDFRRVRFEVAEKKVSPNWGIDLIAQDPVVVCNERIVWSSGGGPLGHPKVFIRLDAPEIHDCGYSGRKFIHKKFYDPSKHGASITYDDYLKEMHKQEFAA